MSCTRTSVLISGIEYPVLHHLDAGTRWWPKMAKLRGNRLDKHPTLRSLAQRAPSAHTIADLYDSRHRPVGLSSQIQHLGANGLGTSRSRLRTTELD